MVRLTKITIWRDDDFCDKVEIPKSTFVGRATVRAKMSILTFSNENGGIERATSEPCMLSCLSTINVVSN